MAVTLDSWFAEKFIEVIKLDHFEGQSEINLSSRMASWEAVPKSLNISSVSPKTTC